VLGSLLWALLSRQRFRFEWFASFRDFLNHCIGAVLMGFGGILAMGCTIGQAITGISTLAVGSFIAFGRHRARQRPDHEGAVLPDGLRR